MVCGRGFAARHLVEMLIRYEIYHVRIADLGPTIKLEPSEDKGTLGNALQSGHAVYVSMDLLNKSQVLKAVSSLRNEGATVDSFKNQSPLSQQNI
ncbi:hypothetical protein RND71_034004 [Anisodus tanguticus]|uniref:Uncharacterized protein n=1 Tax=Anisodus tanguticus TaxID=243964 RepID=A0AAE1V4J6_9SOLA|nr:hypothetical protein RND71_034004 [Anisodus tanguticus]